MRQANPLWGAPRIHGELLKLGIAVAQSTVARYLPRPGKPPSQTWRTFLTNQLAQTVAIDFFTVPTATFRVLFVFVVLAHERRRVVLFGVTAHPTQEWTRQQMREAFPWDQAPRYLLRDRDAIYGRDFAAMVRDMGMEEVLTAPRSPWQNPFVERLIGSIRRECLDHVTVWNQRSLRRILQSYSVYYLHSRTHLALAKDAPESRAVEKAERGPIVVIPPVGGLHHRYQARPLRRCVRSELCNGHFASAEKRTFRCSHPRLRESRTPTPWSPGTIAIANVALEPSKRKLQRPSKKPVTRGLSFR
jgi:transposase InsO family protein